MPNLTDQQKAFFDDMENTFNSAGWDRLTQGWRQERDSIPEAVFLNAKSMDDILVARTRYELLTELLQLAEFISAKKKHTLEHGDE